MFFVPIYEKQNYFKNKNFMNKKHAKFKKNDIVELIHSNGCIEHVIVLSVVKCLNLLLYDVLTLKNHIKYQVLSKNLKKKCGRYNLKIKKIKNHKFNINDELQIKVSNEFIDFYCKTFNDDKTKFISELLSHNIKINDIVNIKILSKELYSKTYFVEMNGPIYLTERLITNFL